jgi:hypothetical protein
MVSLLRSFVGFVALASLLSAQQRPGDGELERGERERMRAEAKAKAGGKEVPEGEEKSEREEDLKNLTPEERLARNITSGAGAYCRFTTSVREGKLMPGQSGTLLVTATLQGAAVMPSPPPIELVAPSQQGVATVGALAVRPADIARLAPGYAGRPVYDNYVVFELPVTLSPEAQIGKKVPVVIDLKFDLYDGASAQPIGRFVDRATAEIEVGAEPKPLVSMPAAAAATPPAEAVGGAPVEPAKPQKEAASANPAALGGSAMSSVVPGAVPPESPAAGATDSPPPPVGDSDGLPLWPILAGGGLVLVLILMLARKR